MKHRNSSKILIIDDSRSVRVLIKKILIKIDQKYEVFEAINGYDALKKIHENHLNLIITDVYMPDMDGLELVQAIRKTIKTKPQIIVMSSKPAIKKTFVLSGLIESDDFLDKFYIRENLTPLIEKKLLLCQQA